MDAEQYLRNDELKIFRGEDFVVSKHIRIHQATLGEIVDYGEKEYFSLLNGILATPQSMKAQLWKAGEIDYTEIKPFDLYWTILYKLYTPEQTSILFGDLDFRKFEVYQDEKDGSVSLCQNIDGDLVKIDEYTYEVIMDYLSKSHFIKRDLKIPMNNSTKMILIEDAIEDLKRNKNKEYHSYLKNLISTLTNTSGFKFSHSQIWEMKINAFMDSVKRIGKIKNVDLLLQSGYSGFGVNLKEISSSQLDRFGELE